MEKKKRYLFLSIGYAVLILFLFALIGTFTKKIDNEMLRETLDMIKRTALAVLIIVYVKKVYKIKIGVHMKGLFKGMFCYGAVLWIMVALSVLFNYLEPEMSFMEALPFLLFYTAVNMAVGLFEEMLCRGLLFNAFKEYGGDNKKSIYAAVFLSAFLFGAIHLGNLNGSNTIATIAQVIYATFFGALFAVIYYRTKNILPCIILHGIVDLADCFWECFSYDRAELLDSRGTTDMNIISAVIVVIIASIMLISSLVQLKKEFKKRAV